MGEVPLATPSLPGPHAPACDRRGAFPRRAIACPRSDSRAAPTTTSTQWWGLHFVCVERNSLLVAYTSSLRCELSESLFAQSVSPGRAAPSPEVEPMSITPDTLSARAETVHAMASCASPKARSLSPPQVLASIAGWVFGIRLQSVRGFREGPGKANDTSQPSEHITNPRRDRHCLRP